MNKYFLDFRKTWIFTPAVQVILVMLFIILISIFARYSFDITDKIFGFYPPHFRWEVIFGPVYEEIIFRGFIFSAMLKKMKLKQAIIYSSIIFGLFHLKNTLFFSPRDLIAQILYAGLIFGPAMAYVTYKTKSIWLASVLHYLNNFVAFIIVYLTKFS